MPPKQQPLALELLQRAHSPSSAQRIHTEKVLQRPLHLKPSTVITTQTTQQTRRLQREAKNAQKKQKPKPLSSRQKRALQLYDVPKAAQKYEIYVGLRKLWMGYMQELLGLSGSEAGRNPTTYVGPADAAKLCSADFHGAEMEVVRSRCVSRVGVRGIVVKDSKHVFEIVTRGDALKIVPKEGTVFRFWVEFPVVEGEMVEGEMEAEQKKKDLIFELHGDQFMHRAADRANKKFKPHFLKNL